MSFAQCPVCALRFRYQSELEAHAHDDHCLPPEVRLPPHPEQRKVEKEPATRVSRRF